MKFLLITMFLCMSCPSGVWALTEIEASSSLKTLRTECARVEEAYADFACVRIEFYQSSAQDLAAVLEELRDLNDWHLRPATWSLMIQTLMASMESQIRRYDDLDQIEVMQRTKSKNHWELLQLKEGLENFWVDPDTYWFPSVNAVSFIAVNITKSQILVISHGERN
ncbi:hypothetical protein [Bdellovibrio bacteriovorus]|uniref:hypothetical protein n=1 Tax=Bdellovibrio bacteriovorus TaxID=959 RepID=UPI003AA97C5B